MKDTSFAVELDEIRSGVLTFVNSLRLGDGTYKMSRSTRPYLFSSCYALFVRELCGDLDKLAGPEKAAWVALIQRCQNPSSGLFTEPDMHPSHMTTHSWEYLQLQGTAFALHALEALGVKPEFPVTYHHEWYDPDRLIRWLDERDLSNPWPESNLVMFAGILFCYDWVRQHDCRSMEQLQVLLDWLDEHQDPQSGFWGTDRGANLLAGMAGAFHFLMFYYRVGRPVQYVERIVDSTLSLQQSDGLFSPRLGGGACEDLDAVDILVNLHQRYEYRRSETRVALARTLRKLLRARRLGGGFAYREQTSAEPQHWVRALGHLCNERWNVKTRLCFARASIGDLLRHSSVKVTEWPHIVIPGDEPDLWSTWFRSHTIALLAEVLVEESLARDMWRFRSFPGVGWYERSGASGHHQLGERCANYARISPGMSR